MDGEFLEAFFKASALVLSAICIVAVVGFIYSAGKPDKDAMTVCQLSHSHDVCFQALNR